MRLPKSARLKAFYYFLKPFSEKRRARRMRVFATRMNIRPNLRILDLGGTTWIWSHLDVPLDITLLNLEYANRQPPRHDLHTFRFEIGDACDVRRFADKSFDIVFSNSVIEHVGDRERRKAFAAEARRLADAYWIQTPAKSFPIEAHTGMPFWWYYPEPLKRYLLGRWKATVPYWAKMVEGTTFVSDGELDELFAGSQSYSERTFGMLKSYSRYVPYR